MLKRDLTYLTIAGTRFTGWKTADITKSIETCSGKFSFSIITMGDLQKASIVPGAPCQVAIGNNQLINGYIDKVIPSGDDSGGLSYVIEGRDKTGDIIDCSAEQAPFKWEAISLYSLAKVLCQPFNIDVIRSTTFDDPRTSCGLEIGETVFEVLMKFAKARNVLLTSNNNGDLVIDRPGTEFANDSLVYGKNLKSFTAEYDGTNRFYKYIVKGQRAGKGNPWSTASKNIKGEAIDEEVRTCRIKSFTPDNGETNATAKARAMWEASSRAAQSEKIEVTTAGFYQSNGILWQENKLVNVLINTEAIEISTSMNISSVSYSTSSSGMITTMTLKRKDAYEEFVRAKIKGKGKKAGVNWKAIVNSK